MNNAKQPGRKAVDREIYTRLMAMIDAQWEKIYPGFAEKSKKKGNK